MVRQRALVAQAASKSSDLRNDARAQAITCSESLKTPCQDPQFVAVAAAVVGVVPVSRTRLVRTAFRGVSAGGVVVGGCYGEKSVGAGHHDGVSSAHCL
jgi:hypothetical protein